MSGERRDFYVVFEFARQMMQLPTPDHEPWSLEDVQNGFWLNADHKLCRESQGKYWVPPSRIWHIELRE